MSRPPQRSRACSDPLPIGMPRSLLASIRHPDPTRRVTTGGLGGLDHLAGAHGDDPDDDASLGDGAQPDEEPRVPLPGGDRRRRDHLATARGDRLRRVRSSSPPVVRRHRGRRRHSQRGGGHARTSDPQYCRIRIARKRTNRGLLSCDDMVAALAPLELLERTRRGSTGRSRERERLRAGVDGRGRRRSADGGMVHGRVHPRPRHGRNASPDQRR